MDYYNRDPRMCCNTAVRPEDDEMRVVGCPGNSFDIATRRYVMAAMGGHNVDPNAHFLKFLNLEEKIEEISGGANCSSIQVYDAYGRITNQIRADLTAIVDGVLRKLATTDELTAFTPSALPEITASIKELQEATSALHSSVEGLTGSVESLSTKLGNIETKVTAVETALSGKQDALFFSSDFVTSGGNVAINYGKVAEDSELPVSGKDVFTSLVSGEAGSAVIDKVMDYIPTITLNTVDDDND